MSAGMYNLVSGGMYNLISKGVPCGGDVEVQETPCSGVGMTAFGGSAVGRVVNPISEGDSITVSSKYVVIITFKSKGCHL